MDPRPLETVKVIMLKESKSATLPLRIALWFMGGVLLIVMLVQ